MIQSSIGREDWGNFFGNLTIPSCYSPLLPFHVYKIKFCTFCYCRTKAMSKEQIF